MSSLTATVALPPLNCAKHDMDRLAEVMGLLDDFLMNRGDNPKAFGCVEYCLLVSAMDSLGKLQDFIQQLQKQINEHKLPKVEEFD